MAKTIFKHLFIVYQMRPIKQNFVTHRLGNTDIHNT